MCFCVGTLWTGLERECKTGRKLREFLCLPRHYRKSKRLHGRLAKLDLHVRKSTARPGLYHELYLPKSYEKDITTMTYNHLSGDSDVIICHKPFHLQFWTCQQLQLKMVTNVTDFIRLTSMTCLYRTAQILQTKGAELSSTCHQKTRWSFQLHTRWCLVLRSSTSSWWYIIPSTISIQPI